MAKRVRRTGLQRALEDFALSFPEAWADTPWDGDQVTKVRKKIFAFYGSADEPGLTVKLPDSADHALSFGGAEPTGYGLGRHGWVSIPIAGVAPRTPRCSTTSSRRVIARLPQTR